MKLIPDIFNNIAYDMQERFAIDSTESIQETSLLYIIRIYTKDTKSLLINDYVTFPDSNNDDIEGYKITLVESGYFHIIVNKPSTFDSNVSLWQGKKPYFVFGGRDEVIKMIKERDESKKFKFQKYPFLALMRYESIINENENIEQEITCDFALCHITDINYTSQQNLDNVFRTVLNPLYDLFFTVLRFNARRYFYFDNPKENIIHERTDWFGVDGNIFGGYVCCIEFKNIRLKVLKNKENNSYLNKFWEIAPNVYSVTWNNVLNKPLNQPFGVATLDINNKIVQNIEYSKVDNAPTDLSDFDNTTFFVQDSEYVHTDNNYSVIDKERLENTSGNNTGDQYIPTALSEFENDSYFVTDQFYVHTDNNYTDADQNRLSQTSGSNTGDQEIPTKTSDLQNDSNFIVDADYVHTDNNFTDSLLSKLDNLELNDLSDVTVNEPLLNDYLYFNGTSWANKPIQYPVSAGAGIILYYTSTGSSIGSYDIIQKTPDTNTEVEEIVTCNNNKILIDGYITEQLNRTIIDSGLWEFDIYAKVDNNEGVSKIEIEVYKYSIDTSETLLFSIESEDLNNVTTNLNTLVKLVQNSFVVVLTDRLLIKVYGKTTATENINISFFHSGNEHYSHIKTPLITSHNDLSYIQGGASNDYNHVTSTQISTWNNKADALGFTPENISNKENTSFTSSNTKYPTIDLLNEGLKKINCGVISQPTITDKNNGLVDIGSCYCYFNTQSDFSGNIVKLQVSAKNDIQLNANEYTYIIANYNSGTPILQVVLNNTVINHSTILNVIQLYWENLNDVNELHIFSTGNYGLGLANKIGHRIIHTERFAWQSGLILSEYGTRNFNIDSGVIWYDGEEITTYSIHTATTGHESHFYYHLNGSWQVLKTSQYNNSKYDNGTNLVDLGTNKYNVNWIYRFVGSTDYHSFYILGNGNYSLNEAIASQPPTLPDIILKQCILVGRIIVKNGNSTATQIDSAFNIKFSASSVQNHDDLYNILGDGTYHLSQTQRGYVANFTSDPQGQINNKENAITGDGEASSFWSGLKTFRTLATDVRAIVLTGLSLVTSQVISASDTILQAFGYLQAQITALSSVVSGKESVLTFSNGLTRTLNEIKNNLITGLTGGQTIIGGTGVTDSLIYKGTTGNGTTTAIAHQFKVGNNGDTNAINILNNANVGLQTITSPVSLFEVAGSVSNSSAKFGNIEIQFYGLGNSWISENLYNSAAGNNFKHRVTGTGCMIYFFSGGFRFYTAPSGSAGSTPTITNRFTILNTGNVGVLVDTPSYLLSLSGQAARTFGMERNATSNTAGNSLTILAGGATSGATDKNGGDVYISSGTATGNGESNIYLQTVKASQGAGTTDRTPATSLTVKGTGEIIYTGRQTRKFTTTAINLTLSEIHDLISVTAANVVITLPTAINISGACYTIDNASNGNITVNTSLSQTINGLTTQTLTPDSCMNVFSNGSNWRIM